MSRAQMILAASLIAALAALMAWQRHREGLMQACLAEGRVWNGPVSRCETPRVGPILKRALERS